MKKIVSIIVLLCATSAQAAIKTSTIDYKDGKVKLQGYLAYDDANTQPRPGILVVHEWWGHDAYVKKRTEQLAQLGYVAFAVDMYGKGILAKDYQEAGKLSGIYKSDRALMRQRIQAGLKVLMDKKQNPVVDTNKIAAIGYCFGGTTVLELARAGTPINGVVSFHGGLSTPMPAVEKGIQTKILVLHGADDPYVNKDEVMAFEDEMRKAGADWQLISYSQSVHGFTNPNNGNDNSKGAAYNTKADQRSWEAMKLFFNEIFN